MTNLHEAFHNLVLAASTVIVESREFRANMPADWEGDPLADAIDVMEAVLPEEPERLPYDLRLQIGKALDRLVCDDSTPEQVDYFITTFTDFGLTIADAVTPAPQLRVTDDTVERVAKALALDMYPDARWPRDEADANSGVDDRQGRHPISWHFANKCRSQARAAIAVLSPSPTLGSAE